MLLIDGLLLYLYDHLHALPCGPRLEYLSCLRLAALKRRYARGREPPRHRKAAIPRRRRRSDLLLNLTLPI